MLPHTIGDYVYERVKALLTSAGDFVTELPDLAYWLPDWLEDSK
jgi:hypothetical protein